MFITTDYVLYPEYWYVCKLEEADKVDDCFSSLQITVFYERLYSDFILLGRVLGGGGGLKL